MNEKYIPLYRKYRPQRLEEVVGQEHIKKALANAIEMNKISHAYLFTGPRGTGKTSTARIFAKSLNCVNGPTVNPCCECENCRDITNSVPMDVIEIDAASNRKVEDAQNILEKVMYAPVNSRYKIYIIDEVHMLSTTAFNALLKTLEEPPKNVIFILATTEVHKVLDTIKSRCQRFDFRRITTDDIVKHLRYISDCEKINITDDALSTIAKNSAGGMRDSIALLDQLSVLGTKDAITTDDINSLLGRISFDVLHGLSDCILASDHAGAVEILEKIYNSGNEPVQILQNLLDYFKNLLVVKNCKQEISIEITQLNELQISDMSKQAEKVETHQIISLCDKCASYIKDLKSTNNPRLWLEIAIIDLANLAENTKLDDLQSRLSVLEGGGVRTEVHHSVNRAEIPRPAPISQPKEVYHQSESVKEHSSSVRSEEKKTSDVLPKVAAKGEALQDDSDFSPMPVAKASSGGDILSLWGELLANIQSAPTRALLKQWAKPVKLEPDDVVITVKNDMLLSQFVTGSKKAVLQKAVDGLFNQENTNITVRLPQAGDDIPQGNVTVPKPKPAPVVKPAEPDENENLEEVSAAVEASDEEIEDSSEDASENSQRSHSFEDMHSDTVNMVMDLFDGKVID